MIVVSLQLFKNQTPVQQKVLVEESLDTCSVYCKFSYSDHQCWTPNSGGYSGFLFCTSHCAWPILTWGLEFLQIPCSGWIEYELSCRYSGISKNCINLLYPVVVVTFHWRCKIQSNSFVIMQATQIAEHIYRYFYINTHKQKHRCYTNMDSTFPHPHPHHSPVSVKVWAQQSLTPRCLTHKWWDENCTVYILT